MLRRAMSHKRPACIFLLAALALSSSGGCYGTKTAAGIAHQESMTELGLDNRQERAYLRQRAEELARGTKGVEAVKGIALTWEGPNRVTAMADVRLGSRPRILTFVFVRFWPPAGGQDGGRDDSAAYWREIPQEAAAAAAP